MELVRYIRDTRVEMEHVKWATRRQALWFTGAVVAVSVATALLLFLFDSVFLFLIQKITS